MATFSLSSRDTCEARVSWRSRQSFNCCKAHTHTYIDTHMHAHTHTHTHIHILSLSLSLSLTLFLSLLIIFSPALSHLKADLKNVTTSSTLILPPYTLFSFHLQPRPLLLLLPSSSSFSSSSSFMPFFEYFFRVM